MNLHAIKFFALAAILWVLTPPTARAVDLPDIGEKSESYLSAQEEQRLGEEFMRNLRQSLTLVNDPEIEAYIQSLGYRLVANSDAPGRNFTFFIVEDKAINAFAGPAGYIGINSGLILTTQSESELAAVIAHEIAHVTQHHLARAVESASRLNIPATAAILTAIILGRSNSQLGEAALSTLAAGNIQHQINFTRANEQEADRVGLQILARSGFDPRSMPRFFERLQHYNRLNEGQALEFLRTHPVTLSRIADTRNRAEQYPRQPATDTISYHLIQARLRELSDNDPQRSHRFFTQSLLGSETMQEDAARYGDALSLLDGGDYRKARTQINRLINKEPARISYQIILARIEMADGNAAKALRIYADNLKLSPHNHPLTMWYARALLQNHQPDKAAVILHEHLRHHKPGPDLYQLLARTEGEAGHPVAAHQALAEYYYLNGETRTAIEQLNIALSFIKDTNSYESVRIHARLEQLRNEVLLEYHRGNHSKFR